MAKKVVPAKRGGFGLEMKTFKGTKGTYIVFKLRDGSFHAFVETQAKAAAKDCGANLTGNPHTNAFWNELWDDN